MNYRNKDWFLAQINSGKKITDIAKECDISNAIIYKWARRHGVKILSKEESFKLVQASHKPNPKKPIAEDINWLLEEYKTLSLTEIAKKYHADRRTLVQLLKTNNIPLKTWKDKSLAARISKFEQKFPQLADEKWLREQYSILPIDKVASKIGCSITAVRKRLKQYKIPIRPAKLFSTLSKNKVRSTRGRTINYFALKPNKLIGFRSFLECGFAMLLDADDTVSSWDYETMPITYFDGFTGKQRRYFCDFTITRNNKVEFIEVKPIDQQLPLDKYLYAKNCVTGWRWSTNVEIADSYSKLKSGYRSEHVQFLNTPFKNCKNFNFYTTEKIYKPSNQDWAVKSRTKYGVYYIHKIEILSVSKETAQKTITPANRKNFDINDILSLIKQDLSLKEIAKLKGVKGQTITNFLERNSYTVRWKTSRRYNQIFHATKKIWPIEELQQKKFISRVKHEWDTYDWLYNHYVTKRLSTRIIGKSIGKSGSLIGKKLKHHGIALRTTNGLDKTDCN